LQQQVETQRQGVTKDESFATAVVCIFDIMKVYADTSTIGGCFDKEFKEWSVELFEEFKSGVKLLMLSD